MCSRICTSWWSSPRTNPAVTACSSARPSRIFKGGYLPLPAIDRPIGRRHEPRRGLRSGSFGPQSRTRRYDHAHRRQRDFHSDAAARRAGAIRQPVMGKCAQIHQRRSDVSSTCAEPHRMCGAASKERRWSNFSYKTTNSPAPSRARWPKPSSVCAICRAIRPLCGGFRAYYERINTANIVDMNLADRHTFIDELQVALNLVHNEIFRAWFQVQYPVKRGMLTVTINAKPRTEKHGIFQQANSTPNPGLHFSLTG